MTQVNGEEVPSWYYVGEDECVEPYVWLGHQVLPLIGEEIQPGIYRDDDVIYQVLLQDCMRDALTLRRIWGP